jgi:outer membrane biogenesis lipoprotein LolB
MIALGFYLGVAVLIAVGYVAENHRRFRRFFWQELGTVVFLCLLWPVVAGAAIISAAWRSLR